MLSSVRINFLIFMSILALTLATACSDNGGNNGSDGGNNNGSDGGNNGSDGGNNNGPDGGNTGPDANTIPCGNNAPQCSNCIDDDNDGDIDGNDVHCISANDNDESSFATGIPGDNSDPNWQDCFFDGNSGAGDDGCRYHTCCLLPPGQCPNGNFDPATDCQISQQCIDFCAPAAPPGCDCFGCCTICNDANQCFNVIVNPAVAPDCDVDATGTPVNCPECVPAAECGAGCEPTGCTLCPGQDPEDLPPECNMQNECPNGDTSCQDSSTCGAGEFCSNQCCTPQIG